MKLPGFYIPRKRKKACREGSNKINNCLKNKPKKTTQKRAEKIQVVEKKHQCRKSKNQ